jgi:hypothetical protein
VNPWSHAAELLNRNARPDTPSQKKQHTHTKEEITKGVTTKILTRKEKRETKNIFIYCRDHIFLQTKTKSANFHLIFAGEQCTTETSIAFQGIFFGG